ncbi:hypothetical protein ACSSWA_11755 [Melioribacter sp. Ez-97]|uniref:hypothetical protein n=1 Tax=Melioribacter sp. Ez-97 TaxID=3423434 RepID=UPI003EDA5F4F
MFFRTIILLAIAVTIKAQQELYEVKIIAEYSGAAIYVDDRPVGRGSVLIKLSGGKHVVSILESPIIWNGIMISDTIAVDDNSAHTFKYKLPAAAFIDSNPQDASVRINDKLTGYTPIRIYCFEDDVIAVSRKGSERRFYGIKDRAFVNFDLTPARLKKAFPETTEFKLLITSSVLLGGIAAYFKLKADNLYDDYVSTGDNALYEKVNRYDIYSGVAFGLLQINFGYLFYKLLTED